MPSEIMDQRRGLSLFSDELRVQTERQIGFWKQETETVHDHRGIDGMPLMLGSKSVSSSPMEKLQPVGPSSVRRPELSQQYLPNNQKSLFEFGHNLIGAGNNTSPSATSWSARPSPLFMGGNKVDMKGVHYENSLFSGSLSDLLNRKLKLSSNLTSLGQSVDTVNPNFEEEEPLEFLEELEAHAIGSLLPDDDDLLSGVIDDIGYIHRNNFADDFDDDIFCSGGGMELEGDENCIKGSGLFNGGVHPYGEHPSRTLFVRNINSNVEDSELRMLFEQYGDVRTLYTACKHRGFVMISYYDIRAAQNALKSLQNQPLQRRKLDIHFSIPKDNPSEKDINQGSLVIFNLDSSVSIDDLHQIFGFYGEIKEIRETPNRNQQKLIEFYDVRDAEAALRALNRSDIAGKRIKLELCHSGGGKHSSLLSSELELGSSNNSPPGSNVSPGAVSLGTITSGFSNRTIQGPQCAIRAPINSLYDTTFHGISSVVNHNHPSGNSDSSHSFGQMKLGFEGLPVVHPHSLPEYHDGLANGIPFNSSNAMAAMAINIISRSGEGIDRRYIQRVGPGSLTNQSFEHNEGAFGGAGNGSCPVHDHQYIWNNAHAYPRGPHHSAGPIIWSNSPSFTNNIPSPHTQQMHGFQRPPPYMLNCVLPLHPHHVRSAPTINPSIWERRQTFVGDSVGRMGFSMGPLDFAPENIFTHSGGNSIDHVGIHSPQQRSPFVNGRSHGVPMPPNFEVSNDRMRSRSGGSNSNQADNKKQYELDIEHILRGEDSRTTLMIKNIPNKYTSKTLLAAIDEQHKGTYDFIYLPIDFKNKCNVGYAFINMIEPQRIISFFQAFNGKKWEKFNSEKVASLAYARIQGKAALIAHFQNSSLMNEDKRCRPILFHSDGPNAGDQEPFPMATNIRSRPGRPRTFSNEESNQGSPTTSPTGVDF